jgi:hypothetical protein
MRRLLIAVFAGTVAVGPGLALAEDDPSRSWPGWEMVLGHWVGDESRGKPGQSTSSGFSFVPELGGKVLVRRDRAEYPAASGRPAFSHEGLMVVHPVEKTKGFRAVYFDNEGHVIDYEVAVAAKDKRIVFTSAVKADAPAPRFRLTYEAVPSGLSIRFEVAPPGKPDAFSTYVEGTAHRPAVR